MFGLHLNLTALVLTAGYAGIFGVIFAESGLLVGFFFPGDSLLLTAGLLAAHGTLSPWILAPGIAVAAILGDSTGYWIGAKLGPKLFTREDSLLFKKRYLEETHAYYERYGAYTIIVARFVPIVRTFAPVMAGAGRMSYGTFLRYNVVGGILWGAGITLLAYTLGSAVPGIDTYFLPIVTGIILLSFVPLIYHLLWRRR